MGIKPLLQKFKVILVILLGKGEKFEKEKYLFYDTSPTDGPKSACWWPSHCTYKALSTAEVQNST